MKSSRQIQGKKVLCKVKAYFYGKSFLSKDETFNNDGAYEQLLAYRRETQNTPMKMLVSLYHNRMKLKKRLKSGATTHFETYSLGAIAKFFSFNIDPRLLIFGINSGMDNFYATFAFHSADIIDTVCDIIEDYQKGNLDEPNYTLSSMANRRVNDGSDYASGQSIDRLQRQIALPSSREIEARKLRKGDVIMVSDVTTETDPLDPLTIDTTDFGTEAEEQERKVHSGSDYATDTDESSFGINTASSANDIVGSQRMDSTLPPPSTADFPNSEDSIRLEKATETCLEEEDKVEEEPFKLSVETLVHVDSGCVYRNKSMKSDESFKIKRVVSNREIDRNLESYETVEDTGRGIDLNILMPSVVDSRSRNNPHLEKILFKRDDNWCEELTYLHSDAKHGTHQCSDGSLYMYVARPLEDSE